MGKLKVLHIIKSLGRGGAEMLLPETLHVHDTNRYEFHYIYFLPWKNQVAGELERSKGVVTCMPAGNNLKIMMKLGDIVDYIRKNQIDIVHCHLPWAGFAGRGLRSRVHVPVIYTEHNKQERYHLFTRYLNRISFNRQDLAIAVSEDVRRSIVSNIRPRIPVRTILNGINTEKFRRDVNAGTRIREALGISPDAVVIGSLSVFRSQKRLDKWLELFARLHSQNPEVRGVLVGDGPLREELLEKRGELGLQDLVFMPGLQTNSGDWFSTMDIFLMTSEFEGLPLALLEAMSCECGVVATRAGGISEVIRDGIEGYLEDVDRWDALLPHLTRLSANRQERERIGEMARKRVMEEFSIRQMVDQLEEIYEAYAGKSEY